MILSQHAFEELLPPYLQKITKDRIRNALDQFSIEGNIDYRGFYATHNTDYLMQADLLHSVKGIMWSEESAEFETAYNPAILISNSCDVTLENARSINQKDALFAPIFPLDEYINDCENEGFNTGQINTFVTTLKRQEYTNLFYLPANPVNLKEYFVRLDRIYWLPLSQLQDTIADLGESRFLSLSQWAWYLFAVKLSLHTCRVPETVERHEE